MNQRLLEFLKEHEDDEIWLLLPSGLISGTINAFESEDDNFLTLAGTIQYLGNGSIDIYEASILTSQIIAWGNGKPEFIKTTEE